MSLKNKIDTMLIQLVTFAAGDRSAEEAANRVAQEWEMERDSKKIVKDNQRAQLNRVLHATRAFDTGLRLFLEKYHHLPAESHSIGQYIHDLQTNVTPSTGFQQLNGNIATSINEEVTKKRNKYVHTSGRFPTKAEADHIISDILKYYTIVLGLAK